MIQIYADLYSSNTQQVKQARNHSQIFIDFSNQIAYFYRLD